MLDKLQDFVRKNKTTSAVVAAVAAVGAYAWYDGSSASQGPAPDSGGFGGGGGGGGQQHEVIDQTGFAQPVRALTIPVPAGWQAQSEVRWNNMTGQCSPGIASPHIRMTSADGREQIRILPGYLVTWDSSNITNMGTRPGDFCVVGLADSGESLVRGVAAPRLAQGARIDHINRLELTPEQQQTAAQLEQMRVNSGGQARVEVYSLEAWMTHQDGTVEVLAVSGWVLAYPQVIAGVPPIVLNSTNGVLSVRSSPDRAGALLQTARQIIAAVQFNLEWRSEIEAMQRAATTPVASRGGGGGGGGYRGGGGGGGGVDMDRWREDQRRDDEAQRRRIETIRETERCYDPETGRSYEVSIHVGC